MDDLSDACELGSLPACSSADDCEAPSLKRSRLCSDRKPGDRRHQEVTCQFAQNSTP